MKSSREVEQRMVQDREKMAQIKTVSNQKLRGEGLNLLSYEVLKPGEERVVCHVSLPPNAAEEISTKASFEGSWSDALSQAKITTEEFGRYLDVAVGARLVDRENEPTSGDDHRPRNNHRGDTN